MASFGLLNVQVYCTVSHVLDTVDKSFSLHITVLGCMIIDSQKLSVFELVPFVPPGLDKWLVN